MTSKLSQYVASVVDWYLPELKQRGPLWRTKVAGKLMLIGTAVEETAQFARDTANLVHGLGEGIGAAKDSVAQGRSSQAPLATQQQQRDTGSWTSLKPGTSLPLPGKDESVFICRHTVETHSGFTRTCSKTETGSAVVVVQSTQDMDIRTDTETECRKIAAGDINEIAKALRAEVVNLPRRGVMPDDDGELKVIFIGDATPEQCVQKARYFTLDATHDDYVDGVQVAFKSIQLQMGRKPHLTTRTVQVTCSVGPNSRSATDISHIGGNGWMMPMSEAIRQIEDGDTVFYVMNDQRPAYLDVSQNPYSKKKYVMTTSGGDKETRSCGPAELPIVSH